MRQFFTCILVGAMITLAPIGAAALSYESIITFTPQGDATDGQGPTSTDEADGNRIVVRFETPLNTGVVEFDDLDFLSITLFGSEGFIFEDVAIVDGMATPLGGVQREIDFDIDFLFDIDLLTTDRLVFLDNDFELFASPDSSGVVYNIFMNNSQFADPADRFIDVVRYVDGEIDLARSVVADGADNFSVSGSVVPLPASVWMMFAGLFGVFLMRGRSTRAA